MAFAALLLFSYSCVADTSSEDVNGDAALKVLEVNGKKERPIKAQLNFDFVNTPPGDIEICTGGDELYTIERVTISLSSLPDTSVGAFSGMGEVVGGTGRFADAEGTWELIGGTFANGSASWEMDGEITY